MQGVTQQTSSLTTAGDSLIEKMGGEVAMAEKLAAAWLAVAAAGTAAFLGGAALAIHASEFRGDMVDVYRNLLGSEQAAKSTYDEVQKIAGQVPQSAQRVHEIATQLLASGLSRGLLEDTIKAMADLEAASKVMGNPEAVGKIMKIIEKANQTGAFSIPTKALVGTGVELSDLYAALAKRLGVGIDQVAALLKAGKISASMGIDALNEVLEKKFHGIAQRQLLDFGTQIAKFKDSFMQLFEGVDAQPFLNALHSVLSLFDKNTATGARLKGIIEGLYNWFFKLFEGINTKTLEGAFNTLLDALEGVIGVFKFLMPYMQALGGGFIKGLGAGFKIFASIIQTIGKALGGLGGNDTLIMFLTEAGKGFAYLVVIIGAFLALMGTIIGVVMTVFGAMSSLIFSVIGAIGDLIGAIVGFVGAFFSGAASLGGAIIDGLIGGIENGASAVWGAIKGVATGALNAAKSALGIQSPSKAFEKLGMFTSMGFAEGIANDNSAQDAIGGMVDPGSATGAAAAGNAIAASASGGAGGLGGGVTINMHIESINAATPDQAHAAAQQIAEAVRTELARVVQGAAA